MNMIEKRGERGKYMEYLEGRLNHTSFITAVGQQFINSIIKTKDQAIKLEQPMTMNEGTSND